MKKDINDALIEAGIFDIRVYFDGHGSTVVASDEWIKENGCIKGNQVVGYQYGDPEDLLKWLARKQTEPIERDRFSSEDRIAFRDDPVCTRKFQDVIKANAGKAGIALEIYKNKKTPCNEKKTQIQKTVDMITEFEKKLHVEYMVTGNDEVDVLRKETQNTIDNLKEKLKKLTC